MATLQDMETSIGNRISSVVANGSPPAVDSDTSKAGAPLRTTFGRGAFADGTVGAIQQDIVAYPKAFSTGSVGWYAGGKVDVKLPNGDYVRCQMTCSITVIGSKGKGLTAPSGNFSDTVVGYPKVFSTGSHGWYAGGKVTHKGEYCQMTCSIVVVGSKVSS